MKEDTDSFEELIRFIQDEEATSSHIELDKDKEIVYMRCSKQRFQKILRAITQSSQPLKILDIGTTPFTCLIKRTYPHYEVTTIDRTNLLEKRCKSWGVGLVACDLDKGTIPFEDDIFDVIIFTEVLEHIIAPPKQIVQELKRVLKKGGKLIMSTPNIARLNKRIGLLLGQSPLPPPDKQLKNNWVHGHGHIREYTKKEIISLLNSCDMIIDKIEFLQPSISSLYSLASVKGLPHYLLRVLNHAFVSWYPPFRAIIYAECHKAAD